MTCLYFGLLVSFVLDDWNQTIQKASNVPPSHDELSLNSIFFTVLDLLLPTAELLFCNCLASFSLKKHFIFEFFCHAKITLFHPVMIFPYPNFWPDHFHFSIPFFGLITSIFLTQFLAQSPPPIYIPTQTNYYSYENNVATSIYWQTSFNQSLIWIWFKKLFRCFQKFIHPNICLALAVNQDVKKVKTSLSTVWQFDGSSLKVAAKNVIVEKDVGQKSLIKTK